ncbi:hypothetical protein RchiOBHm_Chr3g0467741 [Rosa chinensis]|uniref:DUF7086 domain-containing protein n=1 Tax=Rosa chinensis TaxID=74649 RepID=A0A2P6RAA7_ROSCH|nr:uncharacterized protein LOC112194161 [Rosa chinensis]PRQ43368.1 hypothetical protein RchiOBHm_Chr3g0467741 [Rosa chinensis]
MTSSIPFDHINEEHEELLTLQLSTGNHSTRPIQQSPLLISTASQSLTLFAATNFLMTSPQNSNPPAPSASNHEASAAGSSRSSRARRSSAQTLREGKTEDIPAPYPWATTKRAQVYSRRYLLSNGIKKISGAVQCKKCDQKYEIEYDLEQKFEEVATYVSQHKSAMRDRAPAVWMTPTLPDCKFCGQTNCVKPEMDKKRSINWLFLLLGQMLGMCKLNELKYFCKHTKNHRTGAKDRVLYLTYLGLLKQLEPNGPFDI